MTVLVAAASKYGATAEIAEAIGRGLREGGVAADVRPVEQAGDLSGYAGVVLGSAVYVGRWLEPAPPLRRGARRGAGSNADVAVLQRPGRRSAQAGRRPRRSRSGR